MFLYKHTIAALLLAATSLLYPSTGAATSTYNGSQFQISELCEEGETIFACTNRRFNTTLNLLDGNYRFYNVSRDIFLREEDERGYNFAHLIPDLLELDLAALEELFARSNAGQVESGHFLWIDFFKRHASLNRRVEETTFLLKELARERYACDHGMSAQPRLCSQYVDSIMDLTNKIGHLHFALAARMIEFEVIVEYYARHIGLDLRE